MHKKLSGPKIEAQSRNPFGQSLIVTLYVSASDLLTILFGIDFKISERQQLLEETISAREDETESYKMVKLLNWCLTPIFLVGLILEAALFYLYTNMVCKQSILTFFKNQ